MNAARQVQRIAAGTSSTPALLLCDTLLLPSRPHSVLPDRQSRTTTGARHDSVVSKKPTYRG